MLLPPSPKATARLLYAENDSYLGFVPCDNLKRRGYRITLSAFCREPLDLCLLEVTLPGLDGFIPAHCIRRLNAQVPILFLIALRLGRGPYCGPAHGADPTSPSPSASKSRRWAWKCF